MLIWVEWPYKGCVDCNFGDIFQENVQLVLVRSEDMQKRAILMASDGKSAAKVYFYSHNVQSNPVEQQMHLKCNYSTVGVAILKVFR